MPKAVSLWIERLESPHDVRVFHATAQTTVQANEAFVYNTATADWQAPVTVQERNGRMQGPLHLTLQLESGGKA